MLLSAVSFLVFAQSSSEVPEGLMNNPVLSSVASLNLSHFSHYFINGAILGKMLLCKENACFDFLYNFCLKFCLQGEFNEILS